MLLGGRPSSRAGDWIKARAKEKLPSPISRTLSVDLNGVVGRLGGCVVCLAFPLKPDAVVFVVLRCPWVRILCSATWLACSNRWFAFKRDCCDLRAAFKFLVDLPIGLNEQAGPNTPVYIALRHVELLHKLTQLHYYIPSIVISNSTQLHNGA